MSYKLGPINLGDIRDSAGLIARKVESVVAQTGVTEVDIVATRWGAWSPLLPQAAGRPPPGAPAGFAGHTGARDLVAVLGLFTAPLGLASLQLLPAVPFCVSWPTCRYPRASTWSPSAPSATGWRRWGRPCCRGCDTSPSRRHSGLLVEEEVADVVDGILRQ